MGPPKTLAATAAFTGIATSFLLVSTTTRPWFGWSPATTPLRDLGRGRRGRRAGDRLGPVTAKLCKTATKLGHVLPIVVARVEQ